MNAITNYKKMYIELSSGKRKKMKKKYPNRLNNNNNKMDEKYTLSVDEPWFSLISLELKTIE